MLNYPILWMHSSFWDISKSISSDFIFISEYEIHTCENMDRYFLMDWFWVLCKMPNEIRKIQNNLRDEVIHTRIHRHTHRCVLVCVAIAWPFTDFTLYDTFVSENNSIENIPLGPLLTNCLCDSSWKQNI